VVQSLIESPTILKVGVNILGDGKKLLRDFGIPAKGLVELAPLASALYPKPLKDANFNLPACRVRLDKMVDLYTGRLLAKGPERQSNWEQDLTEEQKECKRSLPAKGDSLIGGYRRSK